MILTGDAKGRHLIPRGALALKGGTGMCHATVMTHPFFRPVGAPKPTNLQSMHRFQFLEKICIFNLVFGQNFSSQDAIFKTSIPKTPTFFKGFGNRVAHTHQKSWVAQYHLPMTHFSLVQYYWQMIPRDGTPSSHDAFLTGAMILTGDTNLSHLPMMHFPLVQ